MAVTDTELDSRLARADTAEAFAFDAALLDRLASDAQAAARRRSVRARLAGAGIAVAVVVGVSVGTPAVAEVVRAFFAQTGQVPTEDSAGSEAVPGSEWIDTSASDLRDYIETIYPEWLPLAPGQDQAALIDQVVDERERNPGLQQEVTVRLRFEWLMLDAWVDEWIAAHAAGDATREATALTVLLEARGWPASLASDGGGVHSTHVYLIDRIAAGDAEAAQVYAELNQTAGWDGTSRPERTYGDVRDFHCEWLRTNAGGTCLEDMTPEQLADGPGGTDGIPPEILARLSPEQRAALER